MPEVRNHVDADHESAYAGLLVNDAHWAFGEGQAFDRTSDPVVAAARIAAPEGVDATTIAAYCLALGDDALVAAHRLGEWSTRAPDLEEDIALANIALDLLGQARILLARAAALDPSLMPELPSESPIPGEDRLAFFRDDFQFRNVQMSERPNGDFAEAIVRVLAFSTWRLAIFERLLDSRDGVLAALAAKSVKEMAYHRDFAARWFVVLGQGTDESRLRLERAVAETWRGTAELLAATETERAASACGVGADPSEVAAAFMSVLVEVFAAIGRQPPEVVWNTAGRPRMGRDGIHTEALSLMLAEMQSVARAHPMATW